MSDREPKDWQRKLKEERHVHFVDIMDESRRAPPFDHFPITPSRRGGPIRRLLLKVIPCYSDREVKYLYQEKEAEPQMKGVIGEDRKTGKNNTENEYKNIKTKEESKMTKVKMELENKVKDATKNEKKKSTAKVRRSENSSSLGPSTSAQGHTPQRKPKADRHGKRAQKTCGASQRRSVLPSGKWRPLPPLPRKVNRKPKTALQEDSPQASNIVEKHEKSPLLSRARSPRFPPTAARERRRNSSEFLWRQMRYQQQKIGFILRDKAKERRQAELAEANPKNGTNHDGLMTNHVAQPMAQVESRMSCVSANHYPMNQDTYPSRDEILNHIAQTCSQSVQETKRSIELLELNACAQNDMLITISQILGEQMSRSILSDEYLLQHKELLPLAADVDMMSNSSYEPSTSSTQDRNSNTDELSDWEDLNSISSESVSVQTDWEDLSSISSESVSVQTNYSMRRKSTRKTLKKTYARHTKAQQTLGKRKSHRVEQKSEYSESSNNDYICRSVSGQSESELFPISEKSTTPKKVKKHMKRKSKQQTTKLHEKLSEDVSRTPGMQVIIDVSDIDTDLNIDDTYPSVKKGNTPGPRDKRKIKGRQRSGKPSRTMTVETPTEFNLQTMNFDASPDDVAETSILQLKRTAQNVSEDDTPVLNVRLSPESAKSSFSSDRVKNRGHRCKRHSSQPERLENRPEREHQPTSIGDEGGTTSDKSVSGRKRHAHKYKRSQETKCLALSDDENPEELAVNLSAAPYAPESTTPSINEETLNICSKSTRKLKKQNKMKRSTEPKISLLKSGYFDDSKTDSISPTRALLSTPAVDEEVFSDMPMKTRNTHPRMAKKYMESEVAPPSNSEEPKVSTLLAAPALTEDIISNKPLRRPKRNTNNRNRKSVLPTNDHDDHQANEASLTTQPTPVDEKSTIPNSSKENLQIQSDSIKELHNWSDSDTASGIDMSTKRQNIKKQLKLKKRMRVKRERQLLSQESEISLENLRGDDLSEIQTNPTTTQKTSSNPPGIKSRRKERAVLDQDAILSSSPNMVHHGVAQRKGKEKNKTKKGETSVTVDHINKNEVLKESQWRLEYVALNRKIREQRSLSPPEDKDSLSEDDCGFMTSVFPAKNTDTINQTIDNPSTTEQNDYEVSDIVSNLTTGDNGNQGNETASPSKESKEQSEKRDKKSPRATSSSVWKKMQHNKIISKKKELFKHATDLEKASAKSEVEHDGDMQMRDTVIDAEATRDMSRDIESQGKEEEETNLQLSDKSTTSKHKEPHTKSKTPKILKKMAKQQGLFKKKKNQKHLTPSNDINKNPLPEREISQRLQDGSFEPKTIKDLCQETGPEEAKEPHKKRKAPKVLKKIAKQQGLFKNEKSKKPIEPSNTDNELQSLAAEKPSKKSNNLCQETTWSPMEDENEHDYETSDVNEPLQHRKSMSRWKKFKHDQGLYKKQKNRVVKTSGEQEPSKDGYADLGEEKKKNNSGNKELMKIKEKDTRKQKEDEKRVKKDPKKTKKQKNKPADGGTREQSTTSPSNGKKNTSKLSNLFRVKKDHKSQESHIAPQSSEMKENEIPLGLASCRNGVPTAVNHNIELMGGEAVREGEIMTSDHTSHNMRPSKPAAAAADMNKVAKVTVGWCDPTNNKLKLSNDVTDKKNDHQTGRNNRRSDDTDSGVGRLHTVEGNDVSDKGHDSKTIPTERNGHPQGDLPAGFDNSLAHDEQYELPVNKQRSSEHEEDCTKTGQSQKRRHIMNQILQELDDNSSQSEGQDALNVKTSSPKVTEMKTNQSDSSCKYDIIDETTSPMPARRVKLLSQAQLQVEGCDDDVIPSIQRHQSKTEDSSNPVIEVTDVVENNEECESCDDMIDHNIIKPSASREDEINNVDNSEHKVNSWDEVSENETTNHTKQGNSSERPKSPDVDILDELLDELSPSNKKHVTTQPADNKVRQMAGTDYLREERKGLNVTAADLESDDVSLTQNAKKAQEDQSCVTELDVIEQMLSTSTGKNDFDIFEIVDRMPQSQTKPEVLTTHPEECSQVQTSEDDSSHSGQSISKVVSAKKCSDEPLHGENMVKQCQSSGNIEENTLPKAESEVTQTSKHPSYAPQEEEIDKHPSPREEYGTSSLVIIESQEPAEEKPTDTETHITMSTQEKSSHTAGGKISINPAWGSSLDDISPSTRGQDVAVGSISPSEVKKQPQTTTYNLNTTDDVTHDVPSRPSTKSNINTYQDSSAHLDNTQPITSEMKEGNTGKTNFVDYLTQMRLEESLKKVGKSGTVSPSENPDVPGYLRADFNPAPDQKPFKRWDPVAAQTKMVKICKSKNKSKEPSEPRWLKEDFNPTPEQTPFKKWNPVAAQKTMEKISAKKMTTEQTEPLWLKNDFNPAPEQKLSKRWDPSAAQKSIEKIYQPQKSPAGSEPRWLQNDFSPAPESKPFKRWDPSVAQNKMENICLSKKNSPEHTVMPRWMQKDFNPVENGRKSADWKVPGAKSDMLMSTHESKDSTAGYWDTPDSSMSLEDKVQGGEAIKKESQKILDSMRSQEMFHSSENESSTKGVPSNSTAVDKDVPRFMRADFNPAPEQKPFKRWNTLEAKKKLVKIGGSKETFADTPIDEKPLWMRNDFIPTREEAKREVYNQANTHEADFINSTTRETAKDASVAKPRWLQPNFDPATEAACVSAPSKRTSSAMLHAAQFQHSVLRQPTYQPNIDGMDIHQSDALYDENRYQPQFVRDIQNQHADPALRERSLPVDNSPQWMQPGFHGVPDHPRHAPSSPPDALQSGVKALAKSSNAPAWLHSKPQPLPETSKNKPKLPGVSSISKQPAHQHGNMDNSHTDGRLGRRTFKQFAPPRRTDGPSLPSRSLDVISLDMDYEDPSGLGNSELPRPSWIKPGLVPTGNTWQNSANERRMLLNSISKTQAMCTNRIM